MCGGGGRTSHCIGFWINTVNTVGNLCVCRTISLIVICEVYRNMNAFDAVIVKSIKRGMGCGECVEDYDVCSVCVEGYGVCCVCKDVYVWCV